MLYLFDIDGTLRRSPLDNPRIPYHQIDILPGRVDRVRTLIAQGHRIGLVTNQAGIAFGHHTEEDAYAMIQAVITALNLPSATPFAVCFAHPNATIPAYRHPDELARRKPSPVMIWELAAGWSLDAVIFVGDRDEDRDAAANAGVAFVWAEEFFAV